MYGPLGLDPQKNPLAVDSLISTVADPIGTIQFRIVSFNGSEFVGKWRRKADHDYIALAHIAQDSKGNPWISYCHERSGFTYGVVCNNTLYTSLDGIADDDIRGITADESGIVWCTTDGGISKFTGYGWVSYDTANGVASNLVYKILVGNNDILYAATSKWISILKSNQWKTLKIINEPSHYDYREMVIDKRDAVILLRPDHITIYNDLQWERIYFGNLRVRYPTIPHKSFFKSKDGTLYAIGNEVEKNAKGKVIEKRRCILKQGIDGSSFVKASSHTFEKSDRIGLPAVVCPGNDSCFWLTGDNGNLVLHNNQKTENYPPSRLGSKGRYTEITCMQLDRDGRSFRVGYYVFDDNSAANSL